MHQAEISRRTFTMMRRVVSDALMVPVAALPRVMFHAMILSLIIGSFWLLDSLKDPVLSALIGIEYQPYAKVFSLFVTFVVVCTYDYITSLVSKSSLFHIVSVLYGLQFIVIAGFLSDPEIGLQNTEKSPYRVIGWISYFAIECYGSLMVALFWSFTNSVMNLEEAKGAYGLIIAIAQLGAMAGSTLATKAVAFGIPQLFLIGAFSVFFVSLLIKTYCIVFRKQLLQHSSFIPHQHIEPDITSQPRSPSSRTNVKPSKSLLSTVLNFFSGIKLIFTHRYIMFILLITILHEIVLTILDYEFKVLASNMILQQQQLKFFEEYESDKDGSVNSNVLHNINHIIHSSATSHNTINDLHGSPHSKYGEEFANLLGHFGQMTSVFSLVVSILGFSVLVHKIGVKFTLLVFPICLFISVIVINLTSSFYIIFTLVSLLKAMTYSLDEPVKELLYIPTTDDIKFKAKAWIDVFGARFAKALASVLTRFAYGDYKKLKKLTEIPTLFLSLVLIFIVWIVGVQFDKNIAKGIVVGEEPRLDESGEGKGMDFSHHTLGEEGSNNGSDSFDHDSNNKYLEGREDDKASVGTTRREIRVAVGGVGGKGSGNGHKAEDSSLYRNGLYPGDVGYDGYDLHLFDGVFTDDEDESANGNSNVESKSVQMREKSFQFGGKVTETNRAEAIERHSSRSMNI